MRTKPSSYAVVRVDDTSLRCQAKNCGALAEFRCLFPMSATRPEVTSSRRSCRRHAEQFAANYEVVMPGAPPIASEAYYALVNEMVPGAGPAGAYAIGLISMLAWERRREPDRELLEAAVRRCARFADPGRMKWEAYAICGLGRLAPGPAGTAAY